MQLQVSCSVPSARICFSPRDRAKVPSQFSSRGLQFLLRHDCAAVPGFIILLAGIVLPESPSSLAEHGKIDEARKVCHHCPMPQRVIPASTVSPDMMMHSDVVIVAPGTSLITAFSGMLAEEQLPCVCLGTDGRLPAGYGMSY